MSTDKPAVVYKQVDAQLVAGIHVEGEREGIKAARERLDRLCGVTISGPLVVVHHYGTGVEGINADVCYPVREAIEAGDVRRWILEGGEVLSLLHHGPPETVRESYRRLYGHMRERGLISQLMGREVYLESNLGRPEMQVMELQAFLHKWEDLFAAGVERVLGAEARAGVVQGIEELTPWSSLDERVCWVSAAVERLDARADGMQKFEIMWPCADVFPPQRIEKLRAVYEQHHEVDEVLRAMEEDPDWYESPKREGDVILVDKIIFDRRGYEAATTEAERRTCRCHCPIARQRLDEVHPAFCTCSTGWYRRLWEGILGKPVWVELLECLTRGDDRCLFAIHRISAAETTCLSGWRKPPFLLS